MITIQVIEDNSVSPELLESFLLNKLLKEYNIQWNYPWQGEMIDFASGLTKRAYVTVRPKARIAAALSHYTLWKKQDARGVEPILFTLPITIQNGEFPFMTIDYYLNS